RAETKGERGRKQKLAALLAGFWPVERSGNRGGGSIRQASRPNTQDKGPDREEKRTLSEFDHPRLTQLARLLQGGKREPEPRQRGSTPSDRQRFDPVSELLEAPKANTPAQGRDPSECALQRFDPPFGHDKRGLDYQRRLS